MYSGLFRISRARCVVSSVGAVGGKGSRKKMLSAVKAYLKIHVRKKCWAVGRLSDSFLRHKT